MKPSRNNLAKVRIENKNKNSAAYTSGSSDPFAMCFFSQQVTSAYALCSSCIQFKLPRLITSFKLHKKNNNNNNYIKKYIFVLFLHSDQVSAVRPEVVEGKTIKAEYPHYQ